jgi:hypothetical protein
MTRSEGQVLVDRLWDKISPEPMSGCWFWLGHLGRLGYGQMKVCNQMWKAHRLVYTLFRGTIPVGAELDHLCRQRDCVNPDHLEPVTHRENILRGVGVASCCAKKTHCLRGHPLSGRNLIVADHGRRRRCRECTNQIEAARRPRRIK